MRSMSLLSLTIFNKVESLKKEVLGFLNFPPPFFFLLITWKKRKGCENPINLQKLEELAVFYLFCIL